MSIINHVENLCVLGPRHAGFGGDIKAAEYLENEFRKYGLQDIKREGFSCTAWQFERCEADITFLDGRKRSIDALPYYYSGSTPLAGLSGAVFYLESLEQLDIFKDQLENRIVLLNEEDIENEEHFIRLLEYKAKALMLIASGESPIIGTLWLFRKVLRHRRLPILSISWKDAGLIIKAGIKTIHINCNTTILENAPAFNITGCIPAEGASENVLIGAHYDTVPLPAAAADNTAGTAILLELASFFSQAPLKKHNIYFCAFSSEELDREGAVDYAAKHYEFLKNVGLMLYFDGHGGFIGKNMLQIIGNDSLSAFCKEIALNRGYLLSVDSSGITYLDHAYISNCGVPSVYINRGPLREWHTRHDTPDKISEKELTKAVEYVEELLRTLDSMKNSPGWTIDEVKKKELEKGIVEICGE